MIKEFRVLNYPFPCFVEKLNAAHYRLTNFIKNNSYDLK